MDDELLQDFLVEAGEILEQLNEKLVDLEQSPDDKDLLNAIFRGFHTIKGGAGFLGIDAMVILCHRTEDVFNLLRNGERRVDSNLMDIVLPVLDVLNAQFDNLRAGEDPESADDSLINALEAIIRGDMPVAETETKVEIQNPVSAAGVTGEKTRHPDEITDEEFDALLDVLENPDREELLPSSSGTTADSGDEITEDEFEALLDELHGKGKFSSEVSSSAQDGDASNSDEITEDEFEALLDQLHGKGKFNAEAAAPADKQQEAQTSQTVDNRELSPVEKTSAHQQQHVDKTSRPAAGKENKVVAETSVRVDTSRLDQIMNMVGELVLARNRISRLGNQNGDEDMMKAIANLDLVTSDLQLAVMKTRMQPIKKVFGRFPRVVRDLARSLKKEIRLELIGEDTDLDKNLVEALADPLVHLVRNSVDHGIEMPDEREKNGKPREGLVVLSASQEGDHILLAIEDDGKGMDPEKLRKLAVERGLMDNDAAARLDHRECYNLIFMPGFSTKEEISDISGRGVGMDVVKTSITQLNGSIEIDSEFGKGTRLEIKVPLTLAIMSTLMVKLKQQLFALPLVNVSEIFHLDLEKTNIMDGKLVVLVRGRTMPLFYLNHWLIRGESHAELPKDAHVVVVHIGTQKVGFIVDELIGQEEVVIKPLGALLHGISGLAGATITGDGGIAIILDVAGLMKKYA